jgi:hypothetical protein
LMVWTMPLSVLDSCRLVSTRSRFRGLRSALPYERFRRLWQHSCGEFLPRCSI